MATSTRTRPFSASSASTAQTNGSISSYFTDRAGILGLEGPSKSDRPLSGLLNLAVDAAHQSHESRSALHPATSAYTLFKQRVSSSGGGSNGTLSPPPPAGLDASRSAVSLGVHSSTAVYPWGDTASSADRSPAADPVPPRSAAAASGISSAGAAGGVGGGVGGGGKGSRGPSPLGLRGSPSLPARHFLSGVGSSATVAANSAAKASATAGLGTGKAVAAAAAASGTCVAPAAADAPTAKRTTGSGAAASTKKPHRYYQASNGHDFAHLRMAAAEGHWGVKAYFEGRTPDTRPTGGSAGAASGGSIRPTSATRTHTQARTSALGSESTGPCTAATTATAAREDSQLAVRRVKSASSAAAVTTTATESGWGEASSVGASSGAPRQIQRPEVVARALSVWEGAELEVVCLYDSNFQTANRRGQQGVPLRVPAPDHIGPVSFLYRWYCKRATQFRSPVTPADLPDAPTMPPAEEPWKTIPATASTSGGSSAPRGASRPASAGSNGRSTAAGGVTAAWLQKATTLRDHGGPGIIAYDGSVVRVSPISTAGASVTCCAGGLPIRQEREPTSSGRRLNTSLDPVISLFEVIEMLEDLEVVPQLASRQDISKIFNAAAAAAAAATTRSTSVVAVAGSPNQNPASNYSFRAGGVPPRPPPPPPPSGQQQQERQQQQQLPAAAAASAGRQATSPARLRPASAAAVSGKGKMDPGVATLTAIYGGGSSKNSKQPSASSTATQKAPGAKARPSSAPRPTNKPASAAAAAAANDNVIPRVQPHAEEVRFPVFKDILVRLAVAVTCTETPPHAGRLAASASTASVSGSSVQITLGAAASGAAAAATAGSVSQYGWGRTMSAAEAEAAVRHLLERLQLYRNDLRGLKHRLDLLARMAKDHGARLHANRMRYVAVPSPVEAAQDVEVAPDASPPPRGARLGLPGRPLPPWGVLAAAPAPSYLTAILTEEDQGDEEVYRPAWREFGAVALDLGVLQPGELRRCRLMLHSRGPHSLSVRIDAADAPFCDVSHVGLHAVPPGMPLRVDVTVRLQELGEIVGELRLRYNSSQDRREREIAVPVYGMVCPVTGAAAQARTRPHSASERSALAVKATAEPVPRAVTAAALAAAPIGHCGPPRRRPSSASSSSPPPPTLSASASYLTGYGSSSFMVDAPTKSYYSAASTAAAPLAPAASVMAVAVAAAGVTADTTSAAPKLQNSVRWAETEQAAGPPDGEVLSLDERRSGGAGGGSDGPPADESHFIEGWRSAAAAAVMESGPDASEATAQLGATARDAADGATADVRGSSVEAGGEPGEAAWAEYDAAAAALDGAVDDSPEYDGGDGPRPAFFITSAQPEAAE